jgi:hypothetical protein
MVLNIAITAFINMDVIITTRCYTTIFLRKISFIQCYRLMDIPICEAGQKHKFYTGTTEPQFNVISFKHIIN